MRIHEYSTYQAFLNFTVSSPRPDGIPSHIIPSAKLHDEIASKLRGICREYKHIAPTCDQVAAAVSITSYLPTHAGRSLYALRALAPAGSLTEVNEDYLLDVLRIRYAVTFIILPGALAAAEGLAFAFEENLQRAFQSLLVAQGLSNVFIPGDEDRRPGDRTEIDLTLELGPGEARIGYDIPG